jgi:hypothetical protein
MKRVPGRCRSVEPPYRNKLLVFSTHKFLISGR